MSTTERGRGDFRKAQILDLAISTVLLGFMIEALRAICPIDKSLTSSV